MLWKSPPESVAGMYQNGQRAARRQVSRYDLRLPGRIATMKSRLSIAMVAFLAATAIADETMRCGKWVVDSDK